MSILIAFPLNIFGPVGTVVEFITFPTVSSTVPDVKFITAKPEEVSPAITVYVPTIVVPACAAVNTTVLL